MEDYGQEHSDHAQESSFSSDSSAFPVSDAETPSLSLSDMRLEGEYEERKAESPSGFIGSEKPFLDQRNERRKGRRSGWFVIVSFFILVCTFSAALFAYATWRHDSSLGTVVQPSGGGTPNFSTQSLPAGLSPTRTSTQINSPTSVPSPTPTSIQGTGVQPSSTNPPVQAVPTNAHTSSNTSNSTDMEL